MELSRRLRMNASFVTPGNRLADVGTDHGYIPIALRLEGVIPSALAMDINPGPLERAKEHIRQFDLETDIHTRLSDGVQALCPGEADSVLIAGMGGALTIKILEAGKDVLSSVQELILQPQSEIPHFRTFLMEEGYLLMDENIIYEEGKYYFMMKVRWLGEMSEDAVKSQVRESWKADDAASGLAGQLGPILLYRKCPLLLNYVEWQLAEHRKIAKRLEQEADAANPKTMWRRQEIAEETALLTRALEWYDNGKEPDCI